MEDQKEFKRQTPDKDLVVTDKRHTAAMEPRSESDSPNAMIMMAIQNKYDPAFIKEMMVLQREHKADIAREAYNEAMSKWAAVAPEITKDKKVSFSTTKGQTEYSHATLHNVTKSITESMSPYGLKPSWRTEQPEGQIKVTCIVSHRLGHSESTSLSAPADNSGSKNPIQAMGSTISYLERYTLLALTGLAAHDMDDDGQAAGGKVDEFITEDQVKDITKRLTAVYGKDPSMFLDWIGAETVDTIPAKDYKKAIGGIVSAEKALASKKDESRLGE